MRDDHGAGVISTFMGVIVFLLFLLFAAQLLVGLYTESVVGAVTYDAAASVAGAAVVESSVAQAAAVAEARRQLGHMGSRASFTWSVDGDAVRLTVRVERPPLLPGLLPAVRGPIERTMRVRTERVR